MPCPLFTRLLGLLMCLWASTPAGAQVLDPTPRFALVFGNAAYTAPDRALKNPVSDARLMARTLRELNFDVRLREDLDRRSMLAALQEFEVALRKSKGIGFLYFAGHGVQVNGRNYIVPIGANLVRDVDAQKNALDVDAILQSLRDTGARLNIVVLDACRNSPLLATNRGIIGGQAQPGLAPMRPPEGALVAFATEPGRLASDGKDAGNGLYTRHLARWIKEPNITLEQVFKRTREAVQTESQGEQIPTEYSLLTGADLYLASAPVVASAPNTGARALNPRFAGERSEFQVSRSAAPEIAPQISLPTDIPRELADIRQQLSRSEAARITQQEEDKIFLARMQTESAQRQEELKKSLAQSIEKGRLAEQRRSEERKNQMQALSGDLDLTVIPHAPAGLMGVSAVSWVFVQAGFDENLTWKDANLMVVLRPQTSTAIRFDLTKEVLPNAPRQSIHFLIEKDLPGTWAVCATALNPFKNKPITFAKFFDVKVLPGVRMPVVQTREASLVQQFEIDDPKNPCGTTDAMKALKF